LDDPIAEHNRDWDALVASAPGRPVADLVAELRALNRAPQLDGHPEIELGLALTARMLSDPRWGRHHPFDTLALAWRHRHARAPHRTLRSLLRPRFAG
jgi:hypothetical protein